MHNRHDHIKSQAHQISPTKDARMVTPKVTELSRASAHRRQVAYVRASLLRGITYGGAVSGTRTR